MIEIEIATLLAIIGVALYTKYQFLLLSGVLTRLNRQMAEIHDWTEGVHYWDMEQKAQEDIQAIAEAEQDAAKVGVEFPDSGPGGPGTGDPAFHIYRW